MNLDCIAPAPELALPPCLSNSAPEQVDCCFETIEYPGETHGFAYIASTKKWQSIEDPSGIDTVVNGINDNGVLVGFYGTSPTNNGFVATPR
jgi:hypothetical protein